MDAQSSADFIGLRLLENRYNTELKAAIKRMREWEARRVENDVVQLVLDREGQILRQQIYQMAQLRREARSWRAAPV